MSGGAFEYLAAYVNNGNSNMTNKSNGKALTEGVAKYKNEYYSTTTSGTNTQVADYEYANPNYAGTYPSGYSKKYGDAVWETSSSATSTNSWYSDYSSFPYSNALFFVRGGLYNGTTGAGVFYLGNGAGGSGNNRGFRVVVPVL